MGRQLCLIHANCQGYALSQLLEANPDFAARFEARHLRNYEREQLEQGLLDSSAIFLHQYLAEKWGDLSTEEILQRLPATTQAICIPNCFFKGYWPFWSFEPDKIDFTDSLLEELIERGLPDAAILRIYLKADPALAGDVEQIAADSLRIEKEKEKRCAIRYAHIIEERWRTEQLFLTVNHPGRALFLHIANELLALLGLGQVPEAFARDWVNPENGFWLPLHPVVAERLRLPFASRERRYPCFGASMTHQEYIVTYLACRRNGIRNLSAALAARAGAG